VGSCSHGHVLDTFFEQLADHDRQHLDVAELLNAGNMFFHPTAVAAHREPASPGPSLGAGRCQPLFGARTAALTG
jgi:hypothetical protein